jgi:hypothetical protein
MADPRVLVMVDPETGEAHDHVLTPGEDCPACHRKIPKERSDEQTGPRRERFSVSVPPGEEGVLDELLIALVEKHQEAWPADARSMRQGLGLELVGAQGWKYRGLHFALYAALTVPELAPVEEGR